MAFPLVIETGLGAVTNESTTQRGAARRTGPALEATFRFLLWLIPTVEKFPRSQGFLLGDRIQTSALDVLEHLIPQILWGDLAPVASIARKPRTIKDG